MSLNPAELPIPEDQVRDALLSAAVPGFNGSLTIFFHLGPEALHGLALEVHRRQSEAIGQSVERVHLNVPLRERAQRVDDKLRALRPKLTMRTRLVSITGHFRDGKLEKTEVEDVP
ncbi:MAG TPA: hypothetical protein VE998_04800 [Terriglobales bacterium]|nr:hypothetical protein [Terriglobales bacterium]